MNIKNQKLEKEIKAIINQFNVGNHTIVISKIKKIIKKFPEYLILHNILVRGRYDMLDNNYDCRRTTESQRK